MSLRGSNDVVGSRFVTYFDPADPDRMVGFVQPYLFELPPLSGNVLPPNALDLSIVDPLAPLPAACTSASGCLGTYHFVIRRIKAE